MSETLVCDEVDGTDEVEIERTKLASTMRVIRKILDNESDHDHVSIALGRFKKINESIQRGIVWPDESEVVRDDVVDALEVASMLGMDRLDRDIRAGFNSDGSHHQEDGYMEETDFPEF